MLRDVRRARASNALHAHADAISTHSLVNGMRNVQRFLHDVPLDEITAGVPSAADAAYWPAAAAASWRQRAAHLASFAERGVDAPACTSADAAAVMRALCIATSDKQLCAAEQRLPELHDARAQTTAHAPDQLALVPNPDPLNAVTALEDGCTLLAGGLAELGCSARVVQRVRTLAPLARCLDGRAGRLNALLRRRHGAQRSESHFALPSGCDAAAPAWEAARDALARAGLAARCAYADATLRAPQPRHADPPFAGDIDAGRIAVQRYGRVVAGIAAKAFALHNAAVDPACELHTSQLVDLQGGVLPSAKALVWLPVQLRTCALAELLGRLHSNLAVIGCCINSNTASPASASQPPRGAGAVALEYSPACVALRRELVKVLAVLRETQRIDALAQEYQQRVALAENSGGQRLEHVEALLLADTAFRCADHSCFASCAAVRCCCTLCLCAACSMS